MSCIRIFQLSCNRIENTIEKRDESAGRAAPGNVPIENRKSRRRVGARIGQHVDARLQAGHHERSRQALTRHITNHDREASIMIGQVVVVVAADGVAGQVKAGNFIPVYMRAIGRQSPR